MNGPKWLNLEIPGKPQPQERPFVTRRGTFDRPKSKLKKYEIGLLAKKAMQDQGFSKTLVPVYVFASFHGAHGGADIDNLMKLVLDSFKGIVWHDDKQVAQIGAKKEKLRAGETPHSTILIMEL